MQHLGGFVPVECRSLRFPAIERVSAPDRGLLYWQKLNQDANYLQPVRLLAKRWVA